MTNNSYMLKTTPRTNARAKNKKKKRKGRDEGAVSGEAVISLFAVTATPAARRSHRFAARRLSVTFFFAFFAFGFTAKDKLLAAYLKTRTSKRSCLFWVFKADIVLQCPLSTVQNSHSGEAHHAIFST